jgi:hypothetical protein
MKINEHVPTGEHLEITTADVGDAGAVLGLSAKKPVRAGLVCKACGQVLRDRAASEPPCDDIGPHAPVAVDLDTAVVDKHGRCIRAVHLE